MRTEIKVIATTILAVLALEGIVRLWAPVIDWDRKHIHSFPEIISDLHEQPSPRIVFFGNSLMLHGLDQEQTEQALNEISGKQCHTEKIVPVSTAVVDWIYLYDTYFTRTEQAPDIMVIGFVSHHLPDVETVKIRRLARHFCSPDNLYQCLETELDSTEKQAVGLMSYHSSIYGDQSTIQHRILSPLVPFYGEGVRTVNRIHNRTAARKSPKITRPKTYKRLERFVAQLKKDGVRAYFVPMPLPKVWELDSELVRTVESAGMEIIDAREVDGIEPADFSDGYHLGETGKKKLSRFLGEEIGSKISN